MWFSLRVEFKIVSSSFGQKFTTQQQVVLWTVGDVIIAVQSLEKKRKEMMCHELFRCSLDKR